MNSVYLSLINLCVQSLSRLLSVSIVIWFPLERQNVRSKCEYAHTTRVHGIGCQAGRTIYNYTNIQAHTRK